MLQYVAHQDAQPADNRWLAITGVSLAALALLWLAAHLLAHPSSKEKA